MKILTLLIFISVNTKIFELSNKQSLTIEDRVLNNFQQKTSYEENLEKAAELYLSKAEIPDEILLKLVPENYNEFDIYYSTTGPDHKLYETEFFYDTTVMIFEKVTKMRDDNFYYPSIKLASFGDGEFGETFYYYLKLIIEQDKKKFCETIKDNNSLLETPIKYYFEDNKCND